MAAREDPLQLRPVATLAFQPLEMRPL